MEINAIESLKIIGCGQVINMRQTLEKQVIFIKDHSRKQSVLNKIQLIDLSLNSDSWVKDLLFISKEVVRLGGALHGRYNQNFLFLPFLKSNKKNLMNRIKGSLQGAQFLGQELLTVNFDNVISFDVPIVFIEGRHDAYVSSKIVSNYYESITTSKKLVWFENSAHYPQWEEPNKFHSIMKGIL